jgi:KEOPS complex subunit Cgi121
MNEISLLFGRPKIREKSKFLAAIGDLKSKHQCTIQALDADKVVSEVHAIVAAEKALRAFSEGRNIAKDLGVEILRYASGERQIERALSMGVSESTRRVALIAIPGNDVVPELSNLVDADGFGPNWNPTVVRDTFYISDEEIDAVGKEQIPDLVLERVALVDTY